MWQCWRYVIVYIVSYTQTLQVNRLCDTPYANNIPSTMSTRAVKVYLGFIDVQEFLSFCWNWTAVFQPIKFWTRQHILLILIQFKSDLYQSRNKFCMKRTNLVLKCDSPVTLERVLFMILMIISMTVDKSYWLFTHVCDRACFKIRAVLWRGNLRIRSNLYCQFLSVFCNL
jgi:hypothetical protein